jgi:hypothetical protein
MRVRPLLLFLLTILFGCSREKARVEQPAAPVATGPFEKCAVEKLSAPELRALSHAGTISLLSYMCAGPSFDTLYSQGCEQKNTGFSLKIPPLEGQMKNPRAEADYEFSYRIVKKQDVAIAETAFRPKRAGLAGSMAVGTETYCNALGQAAERPDLLLSRDETNRAVELLKSAGAKAK